MLNNQRQEPRINNVDRINNAFGRQSYTEEDSVGMIKSVRSTKLGRPFIHRHIGLCADRGCSWQWDAYQQTLGLLWRSLG